MSANNLILTSFQIYYNANISALVIFAQRFVPAETAEDIVHDVFLEAWNHAETQQELPSRSYIFMAVRNKCLNYLKREQVKQNYIESAQLENRLLGLDYYNSDEKLIIERENIQEIYNQIEKLPEKCRIIFKMAYFEEKKSAEIAEILHLSIRTVEHQLYLGLKTLRDKITPTGKKSFFFLLFF